MQDEITYPWISNFMSTIYRAFVYLSMLGLKLTHFSKRGPRYPPNRTFIKFLFDSYLLVWSHELPTLKPLVHIYDNVTSVPRHLILSADLLSRELVHKHNAENI